MMIKSSHVCPLILIHAPLRGATQKYKGLIIYYNISIHAPLRGATAKVHNNSFDWKYFILHMIQLFCQ